MNPLKWAPQEIYMIFISISCITLYSMVKIYAAQIYAMGTRLINKTRA